jgi:hypothetical protein
MHTPTTHYPLTANDDKTYYVPFRPVWRDGAPPGVGWWPANSNEDPETLRWWNGQTWSLPANPRNDERLAGELGTRTHASPRPIKWSAQWWLDQ